MISDDEKIKIEKDIYLKAWDIYQARVSWHGEIRWRILIIGVASSTSLISYGYIQSLPGLYLISAMAGLICMYIDSLHYRIQWFYIQRSIDTEHALRDIVLEKENPHVPREVVDTEPKLADAPSLWQLCRTNRSMFWFPYLIIVLGSALAGLIKATGFAF